MPSRNVEKIYLEDSYYHIYNRGVNKEPIFKSGKDYAVFLNLLKRYLSNEVVRDSLGREYPCFYKEIELLAFCLQSNHFHLLIYQQTSSAMTELLRALATSYSRYFNKVYRRVGPVFQGRYKASLINKDAYLQHISRYIHLNPKDYRRWDFSSLPYYLKEREAVWVQPRRILELFDDIDDYKKFVEDYEDYKKNLDKIKSEMANF